MDTSQLDVIAPQLVESIKVSMRQNGNAAVETTQIIKKIYPSGFMGKEQDALSMVKIIDTMFQIANAPTEKVGDLWKALSAYALNGLRTSV